MWEYFRHTRLHEALTNIKPLRRWVRGVKALSSQLSRSRNLRTGRGLQQILSLESQLDSINGLTDYQVIFPTQDIIITPDRIPMFQRQKIVPFERDRIHVKPVIRAVIQSAKIDMSTGVLISADDKLLAEQDNLIYRMKNNPTYGAVAPARPRFFKGNCTVIHGYAYGNYYHWLIECLPKLYALKLLNEPIQLFVLDVLKPKYRRMLDLYLPPNVSIVTTSLYLDRWIQLERLIYSSQITSLHLPTLRPEHIDYIRSTLFTALNLPAVHEKKHNIFIARKHGNRRHIVNSDAVQQLVQSFGFQSYLLEEMSFEDQVRLFHSANSVVAAHGAGLANVLFSGQISVLEMTSRTATPTFALLTQLLGQKYTYVLPEEFSENAALPNPNDLTSHFRLNNTPITIDLKKLETTLEQMT
jgi:capsular polysaccharide biosynthesis protein